MNQLSSRTVVVLPILLIVALARLSYQFREADPELANRTWSLAIVIANGYDRTRSEFFRLFDAVGQAARLLTTIPTREFEKDEWMAGPSSAHLQKPLNTESWKGVILIQQAGEKMVYLRSLAQTLLTPAQNRATACAFPDCKNYQKNLHVFQIINWFLNYMEHLTCAEDAVSALARDFFQDSVLFQLANGIISGTVRHFKDFFRFVDGYIWFRKYFHSEV